MSASERLAKLQARVADADARYRRALEAKKTTSRQVRAAEVVEPITRYTREVANRVRPADLDEERELMEKLFGRLREEGLVLTSSQPGCLDDLGSLPR